MFNDLKKSISNFVKKITIRDLSDKNIEKFSAELKNILIKNEVAIITAEKIIKDLQPKLEDIEHKRFTNPKDKIIEALHEVLVKILTPPKPFNLLEKMKQAQKTNIPLVIAFFGVNGVGKTLSIAKIGKYLKDHNYSVIFAAGDTYRAGSIQQLQEHGKKLEIKVIAQKYGSDAAAVAFDAINHAMSKNINSVLIDTSGRMENNKNLMMELQKICRVTEPDIKIFVGDALTGNALVSQAKMFYKKVGIDSSIINKMDADVKGGAAVSVTHITKKPILFIGIGQGYNDLEEFIPEKIVNRILP